jgi:hypothetical protein
VEVTPATPVRAIVVPVPAAGKTAAMEVVPQPVTVLTRGGPGGAGALAVVTPVAAVMAAAITTAELRSKDPATTLVV